MNSFETWLIEEGETWNAIKAGVKAGVKAFQKTKAATTTNQLPEQIMTALINAKTKDEIRAVAEKMAENGLVFTKAGVRPGIKDPVLRKWLTENVQTRQRNEPQETEPQRSWRPLDLKGGKLVGNPYYTYSQ